MARGRSIHAWDGPNNVGFHLGQGCHRLPFLFGLTILFFPNEKALFGSLPNNFKRAINAHGCKCICDLMSSFETSHLPPFRIETGLETRQVIYPTLG